MTTIIRVKRHRAEDPVEALILSCKRKKTESSDSNLFHKVLNFSGTVEDKDDKVATTTVESFHKDSKYSNFKKNHIPEIRSKQREEKRERSEGNRFMLLSCLRSGIQAENSQVDHPSAQSKENVMIVDVSKEANEELAQQNAAEGSYVYDLYSVQENDSDFNDLYMENLLSVQPYYTELEYRNGEDEEIDPDEDDSNDENNWRNDYPDTDSSMDDNDEDGILVKQLKKCHLGGDDFDELSSDSRENEYLNYDDDESYHYYDAENVAGKRYAKYKANAMRQMMGEDEPDLESESEEEYRDCEEYCRDSD